jgi:S1/P1 Nuclease
MQNIRFVALVATVLCLGNPSTVLAWGHQGHQAVGYIAASMIKGSHAEKQVKKLLQPDETLATAAEWADCAKGYSYCHADPTPEMSEFAAHNPNHHAYHYADIPFQLSSYKKGEIGATPDDVVNILEDAIRVLQGKPPQNAAHVLTKREALFMLAHMTGDIHQPLHVGAAYISATSEFIVPRTEQEAAASFTQGGNLLCDRSKGVHSFWDTDLVVKAMRSLHATTPEELALALLPKATKLKADAGAVSGRPSRWATETLHLSALELSPLVVLEKRKAGPDGSPCQASDPNSTGFVWDVRLPDQYAAEGAVTAAEQITKAGARLARTLQAIWP